MGKDAKKQAQKNSKKKMSGFGKYPSFIHWLLQKKKGSKNLLKQWVSAGVKKQKAAMKKKTKPSKRKIRKCIFRRDYQYGGKILSTKKLKKVEQCCKACTKKKRCRAWSWDKKKKECTLIRKVQGKARDKAGFIAGRIKTKLVRTSAKNAKKDAKKNGKLIAK